MRPVALLLDSGLLRTTLVLVLAITCWTLAACNDEPIPIFPEEPTPAALPTEQAYQSLLLPSDQPVSGLPLSNSSVITEINVQGFSFVPASVTINQGGTVQWSNRDSVSHAVVSGEPNSPDAGSQFNGPVLSQGQFFSEPFEETGIFNYFCRLHPEMKGTVVVQPGASTGDVSPSTSASGVSAQPEIETAIETNSSLETEITISESAFQPIRVGIEVGQTVRWVNSDPIQHTVTSVSPGLFAAALFDSDLLGQGETFSQLFQAPGVYEFFCKVHPNMRGAVLVASNVVGDVQPEPTKPPLTPTLRSDSVVPEPRLNPESKGQTGENTQQSKTFIAAIEGISFMPARIGITVGDAVEWTNRDTVQHTVTSVSPNGGEAGTFFDGPALSGGESFSQVFAESGTFEFFCRIHPSMRGAIVVQAATKPETKEPTKSPPATSAVQAPVDGFELLVSKTPDRLNALPLAGQIVSGIIYVSINDEAAVSSVDFYLDGRFIKNEEAAPYDFLGTESYGDPVPFRTNQVPNGTHLISAVVHLENGALEEVKSSFEIAN